MPGGNGETKGKLTSIPVTSPLYLHPSDNPNLMLTQTIFDGENYELWADAVKNGLDAKNKLGFVEGAVKKPEEVEGEDNLEALAWRQCNAMVKAWIRNVIDAKLIKSIAFNGSIMEIWAELKDRYSVGNAPRVHQLKSELSECKQGRLSVVEYYTKLKTIWNELGNYSKVQNCTCGAEKSITKEREEEKVHQFLMGLNSSLYGNVRTNLLMEDPITTLTRAYAVVLREERHSSITKEKEEKQEAAMAVSNLGVGRGRGSYPRQDTSEEEKGPPPLCTHCGNYYHMEDNCYDKHGYDNVKARERGRGRGGYRGGAGRGRGQSRGRGQRDNMQANAVGNSSKEGNKTTHNLPFTSEEIDRIRSLLMTSPEGSDKLTGSVYEDGDWTG